MQNTQDGRNAKVKDIFYRKIRFAGGAKSKSMALTLPKEFLDSLKIGVTDHVMIFRQSNQIIIQKA
jgi:hypothetical protein